MWATMCERCFQQHGAGVGWGIGQKYEQGEDGDFYLTDGMEKDEQKDDPPKTYSPEEKEAIYQKFVNPHNLPKSKKLLAVEEADRRMREKYPDWGK